MGQQQLLLLVLGAIIVGVAIVVGMNMFSTSAVNANRDAVVQDCMTLATRAQQWYRTPAVLGGGGRSFSGISLNSIRFPGTNENGTFAIVGNTNACTITGNGLEPQADPGIVTIVAAPDSITSTAFTGGWLQ
jgi:hypothetical protein